MNKSPTIDIVVPCYNVAYIVEHCVSSLLKQSYSENAITIYLVNDGSSDTTGEILESFSYHQHVKIIHNEKNRGLSAARNSGIQAGDGEVICFLDSDMTVNSDWVSAHLNILGKNNIVGVLGDSHLPEGQQPNKLDRYLYDSRRGARCFGEGIPIRFSHFLFNNTSLKRSVFDVIELFDENITSYGGEDTELAIRLWEAYPNGLRFSSKAVSEHHHKRELYEFCQSMCQYGKTNFQILLKKYPHYKNNLGGQYINSLSGYIIFNPITRFAVNILGSMIENYWLKRYLVVDSVIRGARKA